MTYAAAIQMSSGSDKRANFERAERLVREAAERGADLVVLPEVFSWRGPRSAEADAGEDVPGEATARLGGLAAELGIHLQAGSIPEKVPGERRCYNTALLFAPDGSLVARYRKIHLFDVEMPDQVSARESATRMHGEEAIVATTAIGRIGLSICYDLRFPELYRRLAAAGAEVICVPSAFTFPTGAAHWETLVRARAIENQAYVIAPDQVGSSPNGWRDYGDSMIVDPWGTVLARAGEGEQVIVAPIRLDYLARVRAELPALRHIRLQG